MSTPFLTTLSARLRPPKKGEGRANPQRDWLTLLAITLTALLICSLWSYYLFMHAVNSPAETDASAQAQNAGTVSLSTVEKIFSDRQARREAYTTQPFVDPSK